MKPFLGLLTILAIAAVLKLCDLIAIDWKWILMPIMVIIGIFLAGIIIIAIIAFKR